MPNLVEFLAEEPFASLGYAGWATRLGDAVLIAENIKDAALSIVLTDDEAVQELNREFRGFDQPTDVLSFGLSELARPATDDQEPAAVDFVLPPGSASQLGEVVIACPTAARQAQEHARPLEMEVAHLLIHGILHLLGYDHYEPEDERAMRQREEALLATQPWLAAPSA